MEDQRRMNLISANDFVWSPTAITLPSFDFSKETRDWTAVSA
jgi:hypothetical protein